MSEIEHYEILVIGSGEAGKHLGENFRSGYLSAGYSAFPRASIDF